MSDVYDLLIVGGGPGGLAAGIYGGRARLKAAVIEKGRVGGQAATTEEVENYPGFFEDSTGPEIMARFIAQAEHFGATLIKGTVTDLELAGDVKKVTLKTGEELLGRAVVLSPGVEPRMLNIKGEGRLRGKGVSYCATCDADFYEELDIVVVGNGDAAIEEAIYLTKFAESVTMIVIHDEGILDCNKASAEKAFKNQKIKWIWNTVLDEVVGDELVESVVLRNIKTGALSTLETNGVFFFVGRIPRTELLLGKVGLDEHGYIIVNEMMETDVPGVYGAGDAVVKYLRQIVTAAADGAIAAVAAEKYLTEMDDFREQVLESDVPVLMAFWSPVSEASIHAVTILENATGKHLGDVKLYKIDTYRYMKISAMYNVSAIPAAVLVKNGEIAGRLDGEFTPDDVRRLLDSL